MTDDQSHGLLGAYKLRLLDDGEFEIIPIRAAEGHVNVTNWLFPPDCLDCFQAELLDIIGTLWHFNFTITNPV